MVCSYQVQVIRGTCAYFVNDENVCVSRNFEINTITADELATNVKVKQKRVYLGVVYLE